MKHLLSIHHVKGDNKVNNKVMEVECLLLIYHSNVLHYEVDVCCLISFNMKLLVHHLNIIY
jgi:hypothetical protein